MTHEHVRAVHADPSRRGRPAAGRAGTRLRGLRRAAGDGDPARRLPVRLGAAARARAGRADGGLPGDPARGDRRPAAGGHGAARPAGAAAAPWSSYQPARRRRQGGSPGLAGRARSSCWTRWSSGGSSSPGACYVAASRHARRPPSGCCSPRRWPRSTSAADAAAHRQADSRLHLAIASVTASPMTIDAVTEVQACLHDMLQAIPVLEVNIEHSTRQHRAIVEAILAGDAARRGGRWKSTATTRPRCCAGCSADDSDERETHDPQRPAPERRAT